ncbi:MAG TPA: radical SAM protein [Acidobacteriota bacterium]|nr:radical SAM protein [Acidobacteriota bacterium]
MSPWSVIQEIRRKVSEEEGVLCKEAALRIALCHPTPYTAAMSSLGFQTMYREIHRHPNSSADRAFLPDEPASYRKSRTPILTYENETPISDFPIIAFSIAYELELSGIFEMLDLSGIPLLRQDRTEQHPLIIAGGPLTYSNPAILYPFVDLVILGEGEELIHSLLDSAAALNRQELLSLFSRHVGCHVPGMTSGTPELAKARDEQLPAFSQILTKNTVLASMFLIEPERGCSRSCAFCVMRCTTNGGMRLVSPEKVFSLIPENARRVGLVGAAVTDHPGIMELIRKIVLSGREIGVSSLRADRLNKELVELLARGGYQTLTTASDGASQRVRNRTGRNINEQHLIRAAELVREAGLRRLKLYEMIGLPGESMDDIDELVRFSRELSGIAPLSLSISPFVAKKNTPLDGAPFEAIPAQTAKLAMIRNGLKGKADVKPASPRWAWVEYMLSQGDESAGLAAMEAWKAGGSFASWKRAFADRKGDNLRAR